MGMIGPQSLPSELYGEKLVNANLRDRIEQVRN